MNGFFKICTLVMSKTSVSDGAVYKPDLKAKIKNKVKQKYAQRA